MIYRYLQALAITAAAVAVRFSVTAERDSSAFVILLAGVLAAAWIGGVGPCIVAQTLILIAHRVFFAEPSETTWPPPLRAYINILAYYGVGLTVAVLSDFVRAARTRDQASAAEAVAQQERLQAVLACIAEGVVATDAIGKIILLNPMAESLLDISPAAAAGKPLSDVLRLCDADLQQPVPDPAQQVLRERSNIHSKAPLLLDTPGGKTLPVSFSAGPVRGPAAELSGVVVVFRDESERRRTEEELRSADRRKDEFLATLAHELRNPLAPICMGLELLKLSADSGVDQSETRSLIERQARHLARLVDDLLDVSRITRGKLVLRKSHVNLQTMTNNVVEACRGTVQEFGHQLELRLPAQDVVIDADPDRFMQVLSNLLNNAAKYTPPGGRISLRGAVVDQMLRLTVADNGRGIEADRLESIFEMFNQSSEAREGGHSGLGIGLTLCRSLVGMHGGTIEAKSNGPGRGSEFLIHWPVASPQAKTLARADGDAQPAASATCRVLLVDDNRDSLLTLSKLVASLGHEVRTADDGLAALEAAEEFRPHAILMDLGMPRMNGYDAAREIRRRPWGQNVHLIAVTGWGQAADRQRTQDAGFDGHLVKPVDLAALSRLLAESARPKEAAAQAGEWNTGLPNAKPPQSAPHAFPGIKNGPLESEMME